MDYETSTFTWEERPGGRRPRDPSRLRCELDDGIATVTLDRPERLNAIDGQMLAELAAALRWCDADDEVRVVVLAGAGRAFCAGSEMTDAGFGGAEAVGDQEPVAWLSPYQVRKPVIAALHGPTVGAGLTLAMQCDLRVVADDAVLALPFVRLGVIAEWMGHWTLLQHVGLARAAELLLTGRRFTGAEAAAWGLANDVVPADAVAERARSLAREIATHAAPVAAAVSKRLLWEGVRATAVEHGRSERLLLESLLEAADSREGVEAFLAKRPPTWTGRPSLDLPPWPDPAPSREPAAGSPAPRSSEEVS